MFLNEKIESEGGPFGFFSTYLVRIGAIVGLVHPRSTDICLFDHPPKSLAPPTLALLWARTQNNAPIVSDPHILQCLHVRACARVC